jgi:hypothetical protein
VSRGIRRGLLDRSRIDSPAANRIAHFATVGLEHPIRAAISPSDNPADRSIPISARVLGVVRALRCAMKVLLIVVGD